MTVVAVIVANNFAFSTNSVLGARVFLFLGLAAAIAAALIVPVIRLNRRHAARATERKFPQFEERLLTFTERLNAKPNDPFLEHALTLEPASAAALWNLSDLLHSQHRDLDRSDDLLVRALAAGLPDGVDYAAGRAVLYARGGEPERASRLLDRALEAAPADPRLHLLRGRFHMERRQCREAVADFDAADPQSALAQASAGLARLCVGDAAGAARNFRR